MKAEEIYHILKSIIEPIHSHNDQMVSIAKWIEEEFEYKGQVSDVEDSCDLSTVTSRLEALDRFDVGTWPDGVQSSFKDEEGDWICFDDVHEIITDLKNKDYYGS